MLVTCIINFAAIVLLRTVKTEESVKILLATLHDTTQYKKKTRLLKLKLLFCTWSQKSLAKGFGIELINPFNSQKWLPWNFSS